MNGTEPVTVTVTHIPLTKEVYNELLSALDTDEEEYGRTAESVNARRWLHYRWLVEGNRQDQPAEAGECHQ